MSKLIIRITNWDEALDCSQYLPTVLVLQQRLCDYDLILGEQHVKINTGADCYCLAIRLIHPISIKTVLAVSQLLFDKKALSFMKRKALM